MVAALGASEITGVGEILYGIEILILTGLVVSLKILPL
jgi:hypothetical protein